MAAVPTVAAPVLLRKARLPRGEFHSDGSSCLRIESFWLSWPACEPTAAKSSGLCCFKGKAKRLSFKFNFLGENTGIQLAVNFFCRMVRSFWLGAKGVWERGRGTLLLGGCSGKRRGGGRGWCPSVSATRLPDGHGCDRSKRRALLQLRGELVVSLLIRPRAGIMRSASGGSGIRMPPSVIR